MKIVVIIIIMKIRNINCVCNFREYIEFRHGVYRFNPLLFKNSVKSEILFRQHSKIKDTSGMQDEYLSFFGFSSCQRLQNKLKFYFHLGSIFKFFIWKKIFISLHNKFKGSVDRFLLLSLTDVLMNVHVSIELYLEDKICYLLIKELWLLT